MKSNGLERQVAARAVRAILFDSGATDRMLTEDQLDGLSLSEQQLLWIDLLRPDPDTIARIASRLSLPEKAANALQMSDTSPLVQDTGSLFWLHVVAVTHRDGLRFQGCTLKIVAGTNMVISAHNEPIDFIDRISLREVGDTELGRLSAASFTASLLDWQLSTYFEAVAQFEIAVERLEVAVLSDRSENHLDSLRELRKGASRLRRMLAPHRTVFAGLSRPDFRPQDDHAVDQHFLSLDSRFERAMDMAENARDLVVGSFELFSSKTAIATNDQMRVLTFVTVVLGVLAVLAGIFGMNFDASFFHTPEGFWIAVGVMAALLTVALVAGKLKRWM